MPLYGKSKKLHKEFLMEIFERKLDNELKEISWELYHMASNLDSLEGFAKGALKIGYVRWSSDMTDYVKLAMRNASHESGRQREFVSILDIEYRYKRYISIYSDAMHERRYKDALTVLDEASCLVQEAREVWKDDEVGV